MHYVVNALEFNQDVIGISDIEHFTANCSNTQGARN